MATSFFWKSLLGGLVLLTAMVVTVSRYLSSPGQRVPEFRTEATSEPSLQIPQSRLPTWDAGVRGGIPAVPTLVNILDYGARGNDQVDDTAALKAAISAVPKPGAVYLPAGTYYLNGRIKIPSGVVIRGAGIGATRILVTPSSGSNTFVLQGTEGSPVSFSAAASAGDTRINVTNSNAFQVGQMVMLRMENGTMPIHVDRPNARGQVVEIAAISGSELTLNVPLRLSYPLDVHPWAVPFIAVDAAGFEDFYVKHTSSDQDKSAIFRFDMARNSWIRNVESEYAAKYHVNIRQSRFITVRDSIFHHSYNYGNGGQGYGVAVSDRASDSLIMNNIFYTLRHAMISERGASGNVWGYNYSARTCCAEQDISMHGAYIYGNLYEGNVAEWIGIADYWGMVGPYNTVFRNRTTRLPPNGGTYHSGIEVEEGPSSDQNILLNTAAARIKVTTSTAKNIWIEKNFVIRDGLQGYANQQILVDNLIGIKEATWSGPASLYWKNGPPDFWGNVPWPAVGADIDSRRMVAGLPFLEIPAQLRYAGKPVGGNPTASPTRTSTPTTTSRATSSPTRTPTSTRTPTPTTPPIGGGPSATRTPTSTRTPSPTPTRTPTPTPTRTPTPTLTPTVLPGDINRDGAVNALDYALLFESYGKRIGQTGFNAAADINADGVVNGLDYVVLFENFGRSW